MVTSEADWGSCRVPGAEYTLSPTCIEYQARMMVTAPKMLVLLTALTDWAKSSGKAMPETVTVVARHARTLIAYVNEQPN